MKIRKHIRQVFLLVLMMCVALGMTGCRKKWDDAEDSEETQSVLYQTYCEDSFKAYQVDSTAALTFYTDGTYSIAQCTGFGTYTTDYGTWEVSDGELSLYNEEGELVGNGEGTDPEDSDTWAQWGCYHYDNADGTYTDYYSTYAFEEGDDGDFVLTMDTQTYYYWGQNGHISSIYIHSFTASEFLEAYNDEFGQDLESIVLNMGTAAPVAYYEQTGSSSGTQSLGFQNGEEISMGF